MKTCNQCVYSTQGVCTDTDRQRNVAINDCFIDAAPLRRLQADAWKRTGDVQTYANVTQDYILTRKQQSKYWRKQIKYPQNDLGET